jgi:hypothetical protein
MSSRKNTRTLGLRSWAPAQNGRRKNAANRRREILFKGEERGVVGMAAGKYPSDHFKQKPHENAGKICATFYRT